MQFNTAQKFISTRIAVGRLLVAYFVVAWAFLTAYGQSNWNFTPAYNLYSIQSAAAQYCGPVLALDLYGSNKFVALYNITAPYTLTAIQNVTGSGNQASKLIPVYYDTYGYYGFFIGDGQRLQVGPIFTANLSFTAAYSITASRKFYGLLLDPNYPLLYYSIQYGVGIVNISNPTASYVLKESYYRNMLSSMSQAFAAPSGAYIYIANNGGSINPGTFRWDISQLDSDTLDVVNPFSNSSSYALTLDPSERFIAVTSYRYPQYFYAFLDTKPPNRVFFQFSSSSLITAQSLLLQDYAITLGTLPNSFMVYSIERGPNSTWGFPTYTFTEQKVNASGYDLSGAGLLYLNGAFLGPPATGFGTSLSTLSADAHVNWTAEAALLDPNKYCRLGNGRPRYPLYFSGQTDLVIDARRIQPVKERQLLVTDGVRNLAWNKIEYTVLSVGAENFTFQRLDNSTGTWSNVTKFLQTDIGAGNIRLNPSQDYETACTSGSAPSALTSWFTFRASDVWMRSLAPTNVSFAIVCCNTSLATVSEKAKVSQISADPSMVSSLYCTAAIPGYYRNSHTGQILACPIGTFNPFYNAIDLRSSCLSCPVGATTAAPAATKWEDCICDYCKLGPKENFTITGTNSTVYSYYFRPGSMVANPHVDRPILFSTAAQATNNFAIGLGLTNLGNFTAQSLAMYEYEFASSYNAYTAYSNQSSGTFTYRISESPFYQWSNVQLWVFYWKGYMAHGYVPLNFDTRTDFSFRDRLLNYLVRDNKEGIDSAFWRAEGQYQFSPHKNLPVSNIAYGMKYDYYNVTFSNSWNVAVDDYVSGYVVTPLYPIKLASTFQSLDSGLPLDHTVTPITPTEVNFNGWLWLGNISASWIDISQNYYTVSEATPGIGVAFDVALSDGQWNVSNWPRVWTFSQSQMALGLVFVRVLQPQSNFNGSSLKVSLIPCHTLLRFCDFASFNISYIPPTLPSSNALDISSWACESGLGSNSTPSFLGQLGTFDSQNNPGRRSGASVAFAPPSSIYMYGGSTSENSTSSELWVHDLDQRLWTKLGGTRETFNGNFSSKGLQSAANWPPSEANGSLTFDSFNYCLWLYGGSGPISGSLWKFDLAVKEWVWVNGGFDSTGCSDNVTAADGSPCSHSNFGESIVDSTGELYNLMGYSISADTLQNSVWLYDSVTDGFQLLNREYASLGESGSNLDALTGYGIARQSFLQSNAQIPGGGFIYQFAGSNSTSLVPGNSVWIFDKVTSKFKLVSADKFVSNTEISGLQFRQETTVPLWPRLKASSVGDIFGNVYIYGGSGSGKVFTDLYVYNTVAESYQLLSGRSPATVSNSANFYKALYYTVALAEVPMSNNYPPATDATGGLLLRYDPTNERALKMYVVSTGAFPNSTFGTEVWSIAVYVPVFSPSVLSTPSLLVDSLLYPKVLVNKSFFAVHDYDSPAASIKIILSDSSVGYFQSAITGDNLTSITYEMVQSGAQVYFVLQKFLGSGLYRVPFNVFDERNSSATGNFSIVISCDADGIDSTTCLCKAGLQVSGDSCTPCGADSYKVSSSNATCTPCPAGSSTAGLVGSSSRANCTAKAGFVVMDSAEYTFGCPTGTGLSADNASCVQCGEDTYSSGISLTPCIKCASGSTTFDLSGSASCWSTDTYTVEGSGIVCNLGSYSDGINCTKCGANSYKDTVGNDSCTPCGVGFSTKDAIGSTSASSCTAIMSASNTGVSQTSGTFLIVGLSVGLSVLFAATLAFIAAIMLKRRRQRKRAVEVSTAVSNTSGDPLGRSDFSLGVNNTTSSVTALRKSQSGTTILPGISSTALANSVNFLGTHTRLVSGSPSATATVFARNNMCLAFPAFLLLNSTNAFRRTVLISETEFAKVYTGDLLDSTVLPSQLLAEDPKIVKNVIIKVFEEPSKANITEQQQIANLENEAAVMYALCPLPNVAKLLAVTKEPERAIVMKHYTESVEALVHYDSSKTREALLQKFKRSWIFMSLKLALDLVDGVAGMHSLEICHLDLKPANFYIETIRPQDGSANLQFKLVIADFSLARFKPDLKATKMSTNGSITVGLSVRYASPEAFSVARLLCSNTVPNQSVFKAIDSYSTAISIWEIFSRKSPMYEFESETVESAILDDKRPSLKDLPTSANAVEKKIIASFKELLPRCLKGNLDIRMTAQELRLELSQRNLYPSPSL